MNKPKRTKRSKEEIELRAAIAALIGPQHCFENDGYMFCNYTVRYGKPILPKIRDYLRWKVKWKRKAKGKEKPDARTSGFPKPNKSA